MKFTKVAILMLVIVIALVVAACGQSSEPEAVQEAAEEVEAVEEQTQADVDAIFADVTTAVTDALEKVGNLPSQQEGAEVLTTDLQDIESRLNDAMKSGADVETYQELGNGFDAIINNVNTAAEAASGEQQVALTELSVELVAAKKMLADSINTMLAAEGKATLVAEEAEVMEADATAEAEAAEAEATAEAEAAEAEAEAADAEATAAAEEVEAAATAATEKVEAGATAVTEDVDAAATEAAGGEEEEAAEATETPASSD